MPGYTWDALLKFTCIKLELLTNIDQVLFIEKGIRGGVSQCSNRHSSANNTYMGDKYDPNYPDAYLMYFDINNMYGAAMSSHLPYGCFKWIDPAHFNVSTDLPGNNSNVGYILVCGFRVPSRVI